MVPIRHGACLPQRIRVGNGALQDCRIEAVEQVMPQPSGSTELWQSAARRVIEAADNLRIAVGLQPVHLASNVQWAAGVHDVEEPAECFVEDLAGAQVMQAQPGDENTLQTFGEGHVPQHLAASEICPQTSLVSAREMKNHPVTSESIPQTLPVHTQDIQQHPAAPESISQTIPVPRGEPTAVSLVEDDQLLETACVQDDANNGSQATSSHPVANPDLVSGSRQLDESKQEQEQLGEQEPAITVSPRRVRRGAFPVHSAVQRQPRSQSTKGSCPVTNVRRPRGVGGAHAACPRPISRRSNSSSNPRGEQPATEKLDLTITAFSLPRRPLSNGAELNADMKRPQSSRSATTQQQWPQYDCSSPLHQARPQSACGPSRRVVPETTKSSASNNGDSSPLGSLAQAGDQLFARAQEVAWTSSRRPCHMPPKLHASYGQADILRELERRSFALHQAAQAQQRSREKYLKGVSRQREALRFMNDELATDGNEEVLLKPLASHSRQLQQASDEHSRQREALCEMVGAECRSRETLQRKLRLASGDVKRALTEFNAAIEAAFEELSKDDRIMPKAAAWNLRVLQYAAEEEADCEMASTISTTQSSTALSSSSGTAVTDSSPSSASWSATSSTGSMTGNTLGANFALDRVTFH